MYLKAIEIIGFKSFAEKSRLDFEPGITCVVGPNGCGKSNVIDSIRWTIGEMSWKSLRSNSMVDIIFNGTAKRAPLNLAQVSMVFDNSSRKLPLDFNEITVTRKIFRSGESEYYLNKVQCRLRDIRDLFLGTGIGGAGYAIIDQGGVESVLAASAEQRREMFEEVAGVSKYKIKKEECMKRLERVDLDLARLADTVALIKEQIKKLDAEARKARQYQKYREELKASEISITLNSIKETDSSINEKTSLLRPLIIQQQDVESSVSAKEGIVAALNLNLTHKQKEFSAFSATLSSSKYQIGLLEGALKNCDNLSSELKEQILSYGKEGENTFQHMQALSPFVEKKKIELAQISQQLVPLQETLNSHSDTIKKLSTDLRILQDKIELINSSLLANTQKQLKITGQISLEELSIKREQEDALNAQKNNQVNLETLSGLEQSLAFTSKQYENVSIQEAEIKNELLLQENNLQVLQTNYRSLSSELSDTKASCAALKAKLDLINTQGENDPYWLGVQILTNCNLPGVYGTLRSKLKYPKELQVAIEESFGKYLDAILCDNEQIASQAIASLATNKKARAKIILLDKVPTHFSVTENSLISVLKYEPKLDNLVKFLIGNSSFKEGVLKESFFIGGGATNIKSPESYWAEEGLVREELKQKSQLEKDFSQKLTQTTQDLANLEEGIKNLRTKVQETILLKNSLKNEKDGKEKEISTLKISINRIEENNKQFVLRLDSRKQSISQLKLSSEEITNNTASLTKKLGELKEKESEFLQKNLQTKQLLDTLNSQIYEIRIKKNSLEIELKSSETELKNLKENEVKREAHLLSTNARLKNLAEERITIEANLSKERDNLARLEIAEHKLQEEILSMKKDFDDKTEALNSHKKELSSILVKRNDLENTLENAKKHKDFLTNSLFEKWNISTEEAKLKFENQPIDQERIKNIRKKIENMGAINMTAPEEYDALTQRNTFLQTQINDLENAKKDLKSVIQKINQTTKENFKYTFEQVRMHFKNIYQTLFRGGECDLVLTQPENLLETGIEIFAQPPGKKLLNISSMSGGEKTLTAMSLLFAFFTHTPSPFCIMDEADAALDEANVERYVNLIKEFSKTTQFIVVTHNKRTMESARMLYGITMEESGVSKVMSVNLAERATSTEELKKREEIESLAEN